jgi:pheromone shutdown protein TraB
MMYVEPTAVVGLNNELMAARGELRAAEEAVLLQLTAQVQAAVLVGWVLCAGVLGAGCWCAGCWRLSLCAGVLMCWLSLCAGVLGGGYPYVLMS